MWNAQRAAVLERFRAVIGAQLAPALRRPFQSLPSRIITAVFAATLVTSLVVAWLSTQSIESFLRGKIDQKFPAILRGASARLDLWYSQRQLDIEIFARSAIVTDSLPRAADRRGGRASERARQEIEAYLGYVLEQFAQYEALFLLGARGQVVLWVGEELELPDALARQLVGVVSSHVSDLHAVGGRRIQVASSPVESSRGQRVGSLHAVVKIEDLRQVLHSDDSGEAVDIYVVAGDGAIVLASPEATLRARFERPLPAPGTSPKVQDYSHADGKRVVGGVVPFARFGWSLVVEEPYDDAFAPLVSLIRKILGTNLGIVTLFSLIAYAMARSIARPIMALSDGALRIASGEADVVIPDSDREDEIGVLSRALNIMTSQLRLNQKELENQRLKIEDANRRLVAQNQELQRVNEVFEQLSITDGLTKLHNHRFFQDHLPREIKRAERTGDPLALILIDIDNFKKLNDRYGHATGDAVLRRVAEVMNSQVREMDLLARYGGEEFALLASHTDTAGAVALAEKIRRAISSARFAVADENGAREISITVSAGVAAYHGDTKAFFNEADRALYRAKGAGKDCVMLADD